MKKRVIKYIAWSVISLVALFVGWQALLIANVYMAKKTARMMIGNDYYMHDYYYADISNITYTGHNFLLYVKKPFLFSPEHYYLYSSTDGITWTEVFRSWFGGLGGSVPSGTFNKQQIFDESGEWFTYIPSDAADKVTYFNYATIWWRAYIKSSSMAYGQYLSNSPTYISTGCEIEYKGFSSYNYKIFSKNCEENWRVKSNRAPSMDYPETGSYPNINRKSFKVLKNIVQTNKLLISLGIPLSTYGDGKYVGIFSRANRYYIIISLDGIHYKIHELSSNVTDSLAISIFSN